MLRLNERDYLNVPKEDVSRRAVIKAASRLGRALELVRTRVPYGPRHVHMSPSELQRALRTNRASKVMEFMDLLDNEDLMNILRERNGSST